MTVMVMVEMVRTFACFFVCLIVVKNMVMYSEEKKRDNPFSQSFLPSQPITITEMHYLKSYWLTRN